MTERKTLLTIQHELQTKAVNYGTKMAVIGKRDFIDYIYFDKMMKWAIEVTYVEMIVSGGKRKDGKGADTLAENWADLHEFPKAIFPPPLEKLGSPHAFFYRNQQIADFSDLAIAFWDEKSTGTKDCLDKFFEQNKMGIILNKDNAPKIYRLNDYPTTA